MRRKVLTFRTGFLSILMEASARGAELPGKVFSFSRPRRDAPSCLPVGRDPVSGRDGALSGQGLEVTGIII